MAKYNCEVCGKPSVEPRCWKHKSKKSIKKSFPISSKEEKTEMFNLFFTLWDEKEWEVEEERFVYCFETGRKLPREKFRLLTTCYHHVLEKGIFPQYSLLKENIVILHPDIHQLVHQNIEKTPKVKALREELYQKHLNGKLNEERKVS